MGMACPGCGETSQVLRLAEFWMSLSQDAELKRVLAQPEEYAALWWVPVGAAVVAALGFSADNTGLGAWAAAAAVLSLVYIVVHIRAATAAQEAWEQSMYCRACPLVFLPERGIVKA